MVCELYPKIYEKKAKKPALGETLKFSKTNDHFSFNIWYDNFKAGNNIVLKSQICIFWTDWEKRVKERYGRPVHHGYRLYVQKGQKFIPYFKLKKKKR